jgi:hypothetical protein
MHLISWNLQSGSEQSPPEGWLHGSRLNFYGPKTILQGFESEPTRLKRPKYAFEAPDEKCQATGPPRLQNDFKR